MRLAALKAQTGQLDAAIADTRASLARKPDSMAEAVLLGQILQRAGQHAEAEGIYRRLLERQPGLRAVNNNLAYAIASDPAATPERLAEALATSASASGDPTALDTLGWVHYRLGDRPAALTHLRKAHEALPDEPSVTYHLARVLADEGQSAEARALLQALLQRKADFPEHAEAKALLDSI
jgi:predicted Zn-dependent protease